MLRDKKMDDKPHIFELTQRDFKKILLASIIGGIAMACLFFLFFRQSENLPTMVVLGIATGMISSVNIFSDDYRGTYILGGVIGTLVCGALIMMNFEDPFLIGFAPLGGLFGALIMVLPDNDF